MQMQSQNPDTSEGSECALAWSEKRGGQGRKGENGGKEIEERRDVLITSIDVHLQ